MTKPVTQKTWKTLASMDSSSLCRLLRGSTRYRLFLLVASIIFPLAILFMFIVYQRYETRRNNALLSELEVAHGVAASFNTYVNGIRKTSLAVGLAIDRLPTKQRPGMDKTLERLVETTGSLESVNWVDKNRIITASSSTKLIGISLADDALVANGLKGDSTLVGNITKSWRGTEKPAVPIVTPIRARNGLLRGAVLVTIDPLELHEVVAVVSQSKFGAVSLCDSRGTLAYHSTISSVPWAARVDWGKSDETLAKVLRSHQETAGVQKIPLAGEGKWICASTQVPGAGWVAEACRPESTAFAAVRRGLIIDGTLGSLLFSLAFLVAYYLSCSIEAPIARLQRDTHFMARNVAVAEEDPIAPLEVNNLRGTLISVTHDLVLYAEALKESETSLRTIFDNVYDGIVIHDAEGKIIDANQRWVDMFQAVKLDGEEYGIADISASPPPADELRQLWREVLGGQTKFFEWESRRLQDGTVFTVEVFLCSIRYKGKNFIMGNVRDITERKRIAADLQKIQNELEIRVQERTSELADTFARLNQETKQRIATVEALRVKEQQLVQQSRLAAMGEMMGNIAHHWRQPLNLIGLIVQEIPLILRSQGMMQEEVETQVERVMGVLKTLSQSIDDFRSLFSPDTAKNVFTVKEVVQTAISLFRTDLQKFSINIEVSCEDDGKINGFRKQFFQVIINILANARDALAERNISNPEIEVKIFKELTNVVVIISDNAGGIREEIMEKVFDPYFTTKDVNKGTGIGLFMSKTIVEKNMGGKLFARNTEEGAEFRIEIPVND